jgi:5-methylcytosine-specific restriction endonuclease McrA
LKRCCKCGSVKAREDFHKDASRDDGLCRQCKECKRSYARAWNARHPERKAESSKAWYEANKARAHELALQWNCRNPEGRRAIQRRWRKRNPEWVLVNRRLSMRARRRRGEAVPYGVVLLRDPCSYCGTPAEQIDHIVPVSRGGSSDWDNLTAACGGCNQEKRDKPLLHYLGGLR